MHANLVILLLALAIGLQPVSTDLYLPGLPGLAKDLNASVAMVQYTLTGLLLAFGTSQLLWGPFSDKVGRRPIMLGGLAVYAIAAIGCVLSTSIETLVVWRIVQGASMGAVITSARAVVRDLYEPPNGARVMSKAMTGLGLMACTSPPLGGFLSQHWGWQVALMSVVLYAVATLALVAWQFKETLTQPNPRALHFPTMMRIWWQVLSNPTFRAFALLSLAAYGALFVYLATSSFVFIQVLHLSGLQLGWILSSMSIMYITGTIVCRFLLRKIGMRKTIALAGVSSAFSGAMLCWMVYGGWASATSLVLGMYPMIIAHGIHQPIGQSGAVGPFPQSAGAASAMNGFLMMLSAFATGAWLSHSIDGTLFPLAHGVAFWGGVLALTAWTLVQWHGEPISTE
ncbi:MAG: Bcr/CflA family efflux MFS transporter [Betaproteobacteria bacterium]|nr:Bcr/CflA family efflux MFS transporter [Betaproteobacteria bacterium]